MTAVMNMPTPESVVTRFLHALETKDHDTVAALLAPDLQYTNVSLPTLRGGEKVARLLKMALRKGTGFKVYMQHIATSGDIVMTERIDTIEVGALHINFWVCGTFRVQDGKVVLWRDYFDWWNISKGTVRGMAGIVIPSLRAPKPANEWPNR